jgi:hypothetical protein
MYLSLKKGRPARDLEDSSIYVHGRPACHASVPDKFAVHVAVDEVGEVVGAQPGPGLSFLCVSRRNDFQPGYIYIQENLSRPALVGR